MSAPIGLKKLHAWKLAICLMATLPTIFILVTWDNDGKLSPAAFAVRYLSLPVTVGELCIILLAIRTRFSIASTFRNISLIPKLLIGSWLIFALLAVALSEHNFSLLMLTTMQYAIHGICLAACIHLAVNAMAPDREWALSMLVAGSLAYVGLLVLFALTVPDKLAFPWTLRLPTGTNVRQIGYFVAIATVAPVSLLLFGRSKTAAFAFAVVVLVAFIAWTGSRGALVGLFLGTVAAIAMLGRLPTFARGVSMLASCIVGLAISIIIPNPAPEFGLVRMASSLAQDDIGSGRSLVWKSTLVEISKSPWTGHGSGSFNQNMQKIYGFDFNHPHQFLLQYVYDWGVIGGILGVLLILVLFVFCWQRARMHNDAAAYASIAALCVTTAVGMIDGSLFYPFSIFLAIAVVTCDFVNDANKNHNIVPQLPNEE